MCKECNRKNNLVETRSLLKQKRENLEELKDIKGFDKILRPLGGKLYEDLSGQKFGRLSVVRAVGRNKTGRVLWLCKCECGNMTIAVASSLKRLAVKSCGCLAKVSQKFKRENLEGRVFTRWTVIKDTLEDKVLCRCSCGTERWVSRDNLRQNNSTSCGCLRKELYHEKYSVVKVGQTYGRLAIKRLIERNHNKKLVWEAECSCGNITTVTSDLLLRGSVRSCGCLQKELTSKRCTKPMIGRVFGRLKVLEKVYTKKGKGAYYKCQCSCGNTVVVQGTMLRSKNTQSCGCYSRERASKAFFKDLTGQRFGKLTVIKRVEDYIQENGRHRIRFLCKCDCGGTIVVTNNSLTSGETSSCGCLQSKGEYIISQILSKNGINYKKQKSYADLRGDSEHSILKFDFYISDGNYLIEYDGQHHFYAGGGWCSEEHVKETQKRDKIKNEYCKKNKIPLIRIPYTHLANICIEDLKLETTKFLV